MARRLVRGHFVRSVNGWLPHIGGRWRGRVGAIARDVASLIAVLLWHSRLSKFGASPARGPSRSLMSLAGGPIRSAIGRGARGGGSRSGAMSASSTGRGSGYCPAARISASISERNPSFFWASAMSSSLSTKSWPLVKRFSSPRIIAVNVTRLM